jgi:hypothetical protein
MHASHCVTAANAWGTLADLYSLQTRARAVNTCIVLATTKKNHLSVSDYYAKMSSYADDLAASGSPLRDDELVAYLLTGLDEEYNLIFTAVVARVDPITPDELYSQLLSFEQHTALQSNNSGGSSSAMASSHSRGPSDGHGFGGPSRGTSHGCGRGGRTSRGGSSNSYDRTSGASSTGKMTRPECQICGKIGHFAKTCWYRYYEDSPPEQHNASLAASSGADNNWYTDSGATDHITGDLNKLTMHDTYSGHDQIHAANDSGMDITHIGNTIISTSTRDLVLQNVMHAPSTHKNLIFVHCFTLDNDTFIEFHPYFFLIKDRKMRKVLPHGPCKGGLYPLPSSTSKFWKLVFSAIKILIH